jgi:Trk K+ transport system NAD-binding subunit
MAEITVSRAQVRNTWRWFRWRSLLLVLVFAVGFTAFSLGVSPRDRLYVGDSDVLTRAYYTIGLFVLGGLDLGVPVGGPPLARALLWLTYFVAPAITASAVIEGLLRAIRPRFWAVRSLRDHIVIAGCGKLTMQYLARLREEYPRKGVVIVEQRMDAPNVDAARDIYGALVVAGDVTNDVVLSVLRLELAERVLLLTGDDFTNLDAAAKIIALAPSMTKRIVVHVGDLHFARVLAHTRMSAHVTIFNTHEIAAVHLVRHQLLAHFQRTEPLDAVVIAGFGRFGQTVLDSLQKEAAGKFDRVVLIDLECKRRAELFDEQVGFSGGYRRDFFDADLRDPEVWRTLAADCDFSQGEPAFVIGSGDDGANVHTALWLQKKYPNAFVVARSFRRSSFAEEISKEAGFEVFSVADLVTRSIPDGWLGN